jgi:hypothetical protein
LTERELSELDEFVAQASALLTTHYANPCAFEHGPVCAGSPVGCSIDHAHLHLVPWAGSLVDAAMSDYPTLPWRQVSTDTGSAVSRLEAGPYLYVRDADGRAAAVVSHSIPSQALRKTLAGELGRPEEWDWKKNPHLPIVRQTLKTLHSKR